MPEAERGALTGSTPCRRTFSSSGVNGEHDTIRPVAGKRYLPERAVATEQRKTFAGLPVRGTAGGAGRANHSAAKISDLSL